MEIWKKINLIEFLAVILLGGIGVIVFYYGVYDIRGILLSITLLCVGIIGVGLSLYYKQPIKTENLYFVIFLFIMVSSFF
jgi:hypothetical protein